MKSSQYRPSISIFASSRSQDEIALSQIKEFIYVRTQKIVQEHLKKRVTSITVIQKAITREFPTFPPPTREEIKRIIEMQGKVEFHAIETKPEKVQKEDEKKEDKISPEPLPAEDPLILSLALLRFIAEKTSTREKGVLAVVYNLFRDAELDVPTQKIETVWAELKKTPTPSHNDVGFKKQIESLTVRIRKAPLTDEEKVQARIALSFLENLLTKN